MHYNCSTTGWVINSSLITPTCALTVCHTTWHAERDTGQNVIYAVTPPAITLINELTCVIIFNLRDAPYLTYQVESKCDDTGHGQTSVSHDTYVSQHYQLIRQLVCHTDVYTQHEDTTVTLMCTPSMQTQLSHWCVHPACTHNCHTDAYSPRVTVISTDIQLLLLLKPQLLIRSHNSISNCDLLLHPMHVSGTVFLTSRSFSERWLFTLQKHWWRIRVKSSYISILLKIKNDLFQSETHKN